MQLFNNLILYIYIYMENFNYCIWFLPEKNHEWYNYTNGFKPHMTIKSNLKKKDLIKFNNIIKLKYKIKVKLIGNLYQTNTKYFYALQYNIEILDKDIPKWWPDNPHISFKYNYNIPYTNEEIKEIDDSIKIKNGYLDLITVYKCIGDFSTWSEYQFEHT